MNDNNRKLKRLVFSVVLAWGMMMPQMVHAQKGGGLFGLGHDAEEQSSEGLFRINDILGRFNIGTQLFGDNTLGGFDVSTQQFGEEAPLGSDWLVLTIAGVAYAFRKRKNNKK